MILPEDAKRETQIAVGRVAQPEDIAHAILFLTENGYMTSKVVACDGGL